MAVDRTRPSPRPRRRSRRRDSRPRAGDAIETIGVDQFVFGIDRPFHEASTDVTLADVKCAVGGESNLREITLETAANLFDL